MTLKMLPFALALALCPMIAGAEQAAATPASETSRDWAAWGGTVALRLNENILGSMGMSIQSRAGKLPADAARLTDGLNARQALGSELFALRESGSLQFRAERGSFVGFLGGSLQSRGGYVLALEDGST
ncbi:hypothetical protein, partial [Dokdonella sp.]|uniref:hypothetical protein n=1 Tax=Dokdonella sp. TaxID=2291710 RepID=UPI003C734357